MQLLEMACEKDILKICHWDFSWEILQLQEN